MQSREQGSLLKPVCCSVPSPPPCSQLWYYLYCGEAFASCLFPVQSRTWCFCYAESVWDWLQTELWLRSTFASVPQRHPLSSLSYHDVVYWVCDKIPLRGECFPISIRWPPVGVPTCLCILRMPIQGVIQLVSLHRQFPTQFDWCLIVTSPYFTIPQSCQSKHPLGTVSRRGPHFTCEFAYLRVRLIPCALDFMSGSVPDKDYLDFTRPSSSRSGKGWIYG